MRLDYQGQAAIYDVDNTFKDLMHVFSGYDITVTDGIGKQWVVKLTAGQVDQAIALDSIDTIAVIGIVAEHPVSVDVGGGADALHIRGREFFIVNELANGGSVAGGINLTNLEKNTTNTVTVMIAGIA
tara:strand:- start:271 stop:654 length:384 start_codon:yes stop_codon:yes gene_type:complete